MINKSHRESLYLRLGLGAGDLERDLDLLLDRDRLLEVGRGVMTMCLSASFLRFAFCFARKNS